VPIDLQKEIMTEPKVCPYPGLRPFNERESIFFKGRDEQIKKMVKQLQEKKFLMVTGASGDGKSSLVYAGLIPNAKAGFFKARFNNWIVADFRPERSPFKNMLKALSILNPVNPKKFETELGYGFSALVDEYKNSAFFIDNTSLAYKNAVEAEKEAFDKKGANLMILVDQLEEFFTYPENYSNDQVSGDAEKVMNLLLETAAIAQKDNIPIYIVCTMRSDYIGQCACFRGLPEAIGLSQFFVPRLKREEIQQVIEGPAQLNGNKISRRLTQKLLNILPGGFDQLPLLQHALNQLWKMAGDGEQEMDSLHLAKIGGISPRQLTVTDKAQFDVWYSSLTDFNKKLLAHPSMGNILNAHAKDMYAAAGAYLQTHYKILISEERVQYITRLAFSSLTKMDALRAVRNQMTLQEITNIINLPDVSTTLVGGLLDVFRLPGATFIRPFLTEEERVPLQPDDVLDITHESLIRNWDILKEWTDQEYENYQTFLDFDKQLKRWVDNKESKDFLLPQGPLSFFEQWYTNCRPNKHWLLKHDEDQARYHNEIARAAEKIENIQKFLRESRAALAKKKRVLILSSILLFCLLSGFTVWAVVERNKAVNHQQEADRYARESNLSKEEALQSKEKAIVSEKAALKAKQLASQKEQMAVAAEQVSKLNESYAVKAKEEALLAQQEALVSKGKAQQEAENARKERLVSESEKTKAEKAEKKAKQLTVLSIAQNLALKSSLMTGAGSQELQALLALQALQFTKQTEGDVQEPAIYGAILTSYLALAKSKLNILSGSGAEVKTMAYTPDSRLLTAGNDGKVNTWDQKTGQIASTIALQCKSPINYIAFAKEGSTLITGHENSTICVWDISKDTGKLIPLELAGFRGFVREVRFSPDGKMLAAVGKDTSLVTWDMGTLKIAKKVGLKSFSRTLVYLPDGNSIVTGNEDGTIKHVNLLDGSVKGLASPGGSPLSLAISIKKKLLIAGFSSGKIKLYDLNNLEGKSHQLDDADPLIDVEQISINKMESLMAVSSSDRRVKIYSLDFPEYKPLLLKEQKSRIKSFIFSDKNILIAGCDDKTIHLYDTSTLKMAEQLCGYLKRNMTLAEWNQYVGNNLVYEKTCADAP
jgi:energy-coupling factor transporter ATP-binding protein EcfA2